METLIAERQLEIAPERIEQKIRALDWRDIQLWCIGFVVLVVLAAGFVALLACIYFSSGWCCCRRDAS